MQRTLPQPVRAGIGLVNAGIERARSIDLTDLATVPVRGLGLIANARERVERTYQSLSDRGEQVVSHWRGHDATPTFQKQTDDRRAPAKPSAAKPSAARPAAKPAAEPPLIDLGDATPGATLAHDELPLEDFDHLTLGSLRARLPKLDVVALSQLRDYERTHANRLNVLTMLDNRIAKLTT